MVIVTISLVYFIVLGKNPQNLQSEREEEREEEKERERDGEAMTSQNRYLRSKQSIEYLKTPLGEVCLENKILFDTVARTPCTSPHQLVGGLRTRRPLTGLSLLLSRAGVLALWFIYSVLLFCKAKHPFKSCISEMKHGRK